MPTPHFRCGPMLLFSGHLIVDESSRIEIRESLTHSETNEPLAPSQDGVPSTSREPFLHHFVVSGTAEDRALQPLVKVWQIRRSFCFDFLPAKCNVILRSGRRTVIFKNVKTNI